MSYTLERITGDHHTAVLDIMNHYVNTDFSAVRTAPVGPEFFDRTYRANPDHPFVVIRHDEKEIVGFAYLSPYHPSASFAKTAKITYFIMPEHTGKGLASRILKQFIEDAKNRGISVFLASISSLNEASFRFHRKHGFTECGHFRNIGRKFDKDFGMIWMQLDLEK